jgi:hypothetical protein
LLAAGRFDSLSLEIMGDLLLFMGECFGRGRISAIYRNSRRLDQSKKIEPGRLIAGRREEIRRQQSLAKYIVSISRYGAFKEAVSAICVTGLEGHELFIASTERYGKEE